MFDAENYEISISKVTVDGDVLYRATVKELLHVDCYEETWMEAYGSAVDVIAGLYEAACETGKSFPAPQRKEEDFSGRVTLRLPRTLHRQVDSFADSENVSLNYYLVSVISEAVGRVQASIEFAQVVNVQTRLQKIDRGWWDAAYVSSSRTGAVLVGPMTTVDIEKEMAGADEIPHWVPMTMSRT